MVSFSPVQQWASSPILVGSPRYATVGRNGSLRGTKITFTLTDVLSIEDQVGKAELQRIKIGQNTEEAKLSLQVFLRKMTLIYSSFDMTYDVT